MATSSSSSSSSSWALSLLLPLCLVGMVTSCRIPYCCQDYNSYIDQQSEVPSCAEVQNWCIYYSPDCFSDDDADDNVQLEIQQASSGNGNTSDNKSLTSGESAMIAIGAILIVAVVAAVGVSVWRKNEVTERSDSIELTENLVGEVAEQPRRSDSNGMLTVMTVVSCVVAVVALIVAVVAISENKSNSSSPASSSSGNGLEATQSTYLSNAQLRTGPTKLAMTGMISSHPWCHQTTVHWASCTELQENMKNLIDAIGSQEAEVNETMRMVTEGRAGDRTFVASNNTFIAASPQLARIGAKLNQPHQLANTTVCTHFTPTSKQVCVSMHTSLETNESVLVAYLNPNTKSNSKRARRNHHSFGQDLSNNWHGSWHGAEHAVENGAIHGAESGAWHGAVTGAIAGIAGGPAGVIGGAISGAAEGAVKGAVQGGVSAGENYVKSNAIQDAESTASDMFGSDDDDGF